MVFAALMAIGRLLTPRVMRRIGLRKFFILTELACLVSSPMAAWHDHPFFVVMWLCMLGFAVSGIFPSANAYAGDCFPKASSTNVRHAQWHVPRWRARRSGGFRVDR